MKSFAVIGLGRFGYKIATTLYEYGADVIAIDRHEETINEIADHVTRAVIADAESKNDLKQLGIADCDCVIVSLGSNFSASVLITMNVKSMGVKQVICKAHDDTHREILEKLGADKVIIPERAVAEKTARMLMSKNFFDFIEFSDQFGILEIYPPKSWIGKKVRELNIRNKYNVNIIAIKTEQKTRVNISADDEIKKDMQIVMLGEYDALNQIERIK